MHAKKPVNMVKAVVLAICAVLAMACLGMASAQVTSKDLTKCKALATALKFDVSGSTVFCPTNEAFGELADDLNLKSADDVIPLATKNPDLFKQILSFHIAKGVLPSDKVKSGLVIPTLLGPKDTLTVGVDEDRMTTLYYMAPGADPEDPSEEAEVATFDLTFEGPYAKGKSKYVVHAIEEVMIPPKAGAAFKKLATSARGASKGGRKLKM